MNSITPDVFRANPARKRKSISFNPWKAYTQWLLRLEIRRRQVMIDSLGQRRANAEREALDNRNKMIERGHRMIAEAPLRYQDDLEHIGMVFEAERTSLLLQQSNAKKELSE